MHSSENVHPLPLCIFLINICWSPVESDAGAARDATTTAAVLKWKPEVVEISGGMACPLSDTNFSGVAFYRSPSNHSWHHNGGHVENWSLLMAKHRDVSKALHGMRVEVELLLDLFIKQKRSCFSPVQFDLIYEKV